MDETPEAKANREYYERFEKEEDRLYQRANMAEQLFIKFIAGFGMEPTAATLRQFKRRAEKAAAIYYELPKPKKVKEQAPNSIAEYIKKTLANGGLITVYSYGRLYGVDSSEVLRALATFDKGDTLLANDSLTEFQLNGLQSYFRAGQHYR